MSKACAIVLLSGGLDSATCLALAAHAGHRVYALSISYGQRHGVELQAAQKLAKQFSVEQHRILTLPLDDWGGSSLTDSKQAIPDYVEDNSIPSTYVPARNTLFLSMGLAWGEVLSARHLYIGVSQVDYSGYPDCRPEYIAAFQQLANVATKAAVEGAPMVIHAPLMQCSKAQTIKLGIAHGVDYADTISCYQANVQGQACGRCDSCQLRSKGFVEAGVPDPTRYLP